MEFSPLRYENTYFMRGAVWLLPASSDVFSAPAGRSENLILYEALTRYNTAEVKLNLSYAYTKLDWKRSSSKPRQRGSFSITQKS